MCSLSSQVISFSLEESGWKLDCSPRWAQGSVLMWLEEISMPKLPKTRAPRLQSEGGVS